MEDEDRIKRMGVRTGAAGSAPTGPRQTPSDIVDVLMDPERKTLRIKKEVTGDAE